MTSAFLPFQTQSVASSSGVKPKRKRAGSIEAEDAAAKHQRTRPMHIDVSGAGFAYPPEMIPDMTTSTTASESDQMMDHDMDFDMDETVETPFSNGNDSQYCYAEGGSGGFGFGPGAEEDDMDSDEGSPKQGYAQLGVYPQVTPYPPYSNFGQTASYGNGAANTGLMQPSNGMALGPDASAVDRARNAHGPHCTSIPKLRMSDYPDAVTGQRSLWSVCQDCGACERTS